MGRKLAISAADFIPADADTIAALSEAAQTCRGCPLYANATQTVFGEGAGSARIMLVGEKPGDREDQEGHPFVGPAGRELDRALKDAGVDPRSVYVTNAVKHFKFVQRGKRRIHQKPSATEVQACLPWLEREIDVVRPDVMVLLGATAAQAILGSSFRISKQRGELVHVSGRPPCIATWHPSAILRMQESADRARLRADVVADLRLAMRLASKRAA